MGKASPLTLVIQSGGESRRMGQDKGLALFLGAPLIARVLGRLRPLAAEVLVTTNNLQAYGFLGVPCLPDLIPGGGALGGLYTALSAASHEAVAVVACDMPFASPALLAEQYRLLDATPADLVIPETGEGLEPFHAVYRRETCLPQVRAALEGGLRRVDSWFAQVGVRRLGEEEIRRYDPQGLAFRNVNTLEELRQAEETALNLREKNSGGWRQRRKKGTR
ncbi:MAG: molybdenum cofactor guanylyltransferase [Anaerolineales bacterium]|nr:molybdenum cofactor guanylyltransferase [Anaerolineales bacterium]